MNKNSLICNYIASHPDSWEDDFEQLKIKSKRWNGQIIFSYDALADFSNPIVREARGIIIDEASLDVICFPFSKFMNYGEENADEIDWSTARVQTKIDGSIVKVFWNPHTRQWQWATNGMIDAHEAKCGGVYSYSFYDMIIGADNYRKIPFEAMNKECTYMFELTGPYNQVVIKYDHSHLTHIGTRNNLTGEEYDLDIGIEKPKEYPLHSIEDCLAAVKSLNDGLEYPEHEGFVVVDASWHRVKIKTPEYLVFHRVATNDLTKKKKYVLQILMSDNQLDYDKHLNQCPDQLLVFKYYDYQLMKFRRDVTLFINIARRLYEEYDGDRKAVALIIKDHPYSAFGFMGITNQNLTIDDMINSGNVKIEKYIPDYVPEDFRSLFIQDNKEEGEEK